MARVRLNQVTKLFGSTVAVDHFDIEVADGDTHVVDRGEKVGKLLCHGGQPTKA